MRFIGMHKVDASSEADVPPSPELMANMGKLMGDLMQSGALVAGEGLHPSSKRTRLTFAKGKRTVTDGPYTGSNELYRGFALIKVRSKEEAIEWSSRYAAVVGDAELELGPVKEPWELGVGPKPEGAPLRYLVLHKSDKASESGAPMDPKVSAAMGKLIAEMKAAGVLLMTEGIQPSAKGARLKVSGGKRSIVDGPFAESKELIAGFVILDVKSKEEMIEWSWRFAGVIGDIEMDMRPLYDQPAA